MPATATPHLISDYELKAQGRTLVEGIESFAVGKWNDTTWTAKDLQSMVDAFPATEYDVQPVITTSHGKDDNAGKTLGYVTSVYTNERPFADQRGVKVKPGERLFVDALVDDALVEDVRKARYTRPSVEIKLDYEDLTEPGKTWPAVLTAVSFIGGTHLPAVRVTEPLARTLGRQFGTRLPLHFREGGRDRLLTVHDDAQHPEVFMDPEVMKILQQLVAGQEAILAALPKTAPASEGEMSNQPPAAQMAEGAPAMAPAPAPAAPTPTPPANPSLIPTGPSSVTLKYSEGKEVDTLKARIQALELENAVTRAAARRLQERDQVRAQVVKFSEPGNMRIAPAQVEAYTDLALAIPAGEGKLKFSDSAGKVSDMSPREAFFAQLGTRPDQTKMLRSSLVSLSRPPSLSNVLAFSEQAEATAKEKGIPVARAIQSQLDEITDVNELHALVFGSNGNNGQNSTAEG